MVPSDEGGIMLVVPDMNLCEHRMGGGGGEERVKSTKDLD